MGRQRTTNKHLPRYCYIEHGSYWYRPRKGINIKLARVGDESTMYRKMADLIMPHEPIDRATGTLTDYFDRYEREIVPTLAPRTQRDYQKHLQILRREFGEKMPDDVEPRDVGRFLDVPTGKIQRVRVCAVLSAVYTKMVGKWYVAKTNPCTKVERAKNPPRNRYITDAEYDAIYAIMPPRIRVAMELALLTGQRQGDILKLKWDDCDSDGVVFKQSKTGQARKVLYTDRLHECLRAASRLVPQIPRDFVVHTDEGTQYTPEGFRSSWQRYMRKALKTGVLKVRFTFHDIRAKTVSDEENVDTAQLRAGHTSKTMTLRVYSRKIRNVVALK